MTLNLRDPIIAVIGTLNVGKTTLLASVCDERSEFHHPHTQRTHLYEIGRNAIELIIGSSNQKFPTDFTGLTFLDTPGHPVFKYQRDVAIRASDLIIIVVDILKPLPRDIIECLATLVANNKRFIIAANKIDTIPGWKSTPGSNIVSSIKLHSTQTQQQLQSVLRELINEFANIGVGIKLYYENRDQRTFANIVPISAKTQEGLPDLLLLIGLLSRRYLKIDLISHITLSKAIIIDHIYHPIFGETSLGIVTSGKINTRDTLCAISSSGGIVSANVNTIYEPRGKSGVIIDNVSAGDSMLIKTSNSDIALGETCFAYTNELQQLKWVKELSAIVETNPPIIKPSQKLDVKGICVCSTSVGVLEGLVDACRKEKIGVAMTHFGDFDQKSLILFETQYSKLDSSAMIDRLYNLRYRVVLVLSSSQPKIEANNIKIFVADTVFKLIDEYKKIVKQIDTAIIAQCPELISNTELKILPEHVYNKTNPIVMCVHVVSGELRSGMVLGFNNQRLGTVMSQQFDKQSVDISRSGDDVCVKIDTTFVYGDDFDENNIITTYLDADLRAIRDRYPDLFGGTTRSVQKA